MDEERSEVYFMIEHKKKPGYKESPCRREWDRWGLVEKRVNDLKTRLKNAVPRRYYLSDLEGVYLTATEAHCMWYLLKYKTISEAAKQLNFSDRTVEFYIINMMHKLNCVHPKELMAVIGNMDFSERYASEFAYQEDTV